MQYMALGCTVPIVVRKECTRTSSVGESFIYGAIDGEVLNGISEMLKLV